MTMADRIAIMNGGKLQQFDTPDAVYNTPANLFVAGFIGTPSMNLVDGALNDRGFSFAGQMVELPEGFLMPHVKAGDAVLGVRPEDISIGDGDIPATIRLIENTGHEQIVTVEIAGGPRVLARAPAGEKLTVGDETQLGFTTERLHIFAKAGDGERLNAGAAGSSIVDLAERRNAGGGK
jgi:ABC-type sugar transport system ATPase subunit